MQLIVDPANSRRLPKEHSVYSKRKKGRIGAGRFTGVHRFERVIDVAARCDAHVA